MQKFLIALVTSITITMSASTVFAIDTYLFPTDILKPAMVGVTAGYQFEYLTKENTFVGGTYDYSDTVHHIFAKSDVGLGYGLQAGVIVRATPSSRVINDEYSNNPGRKNVYHHSGVGNPTFRIKYSPAELLALRDDLGLAIGYSYKPGKWGSSQLSDYGFDTHTVSLYGSIASGSFRTYAGWESDFNDGYNYRAANVHQLEAGTEYNLNPGLALTLDAAGGFVGSSSNTNDHGFGRVELGAEYELGRKIWVVPFMDFEYVGSYNFGSQISGALFEQIYGVDLRFVF